MTRYIALFVTLVTGMLFAAEPPPLEGQRVASITVMAKHLAPGDKFDSKAVIARLKTKEGNAFVHADFDEDLKLLVRDYDRVEPDVQTVNNQVSITLTLTPKAIIRSINWHGNCHLSNRALSRELDVKPGVVFDRHTFTTAFNKVREFYVKRGYFEAQLDYSVVRDDNTNEVDINIEVVEGRSGGIQEIIFTGFTKRQESELCEMIMTKRYNLFTSWMTGEGIYHEEMIQQDELLIVDYLQNHGYADAAVQIKVRDAQSERIYLEIVATKGPRYHFGKITIHGNTIFDDAKIASLMLAKEGKIFSPKKLRDTRECIQDLYGSKGYIDAVVTFQPHLNDKEPKYDVDFTIEEGKQYRLGMIHIIGNTSTQNRVILHESFLCPGEIFNARRLKLTEQKLMAIGYFSHVNVYACQPNDCCCLGNEYRDVTIEVEECGTGNVSAGVGFSTSDSLFGNISLTERNFNIAGLPRIFDEGMRALRGNGEYAVVSATIGTHLNQYSVSWAKPFIYDTPWTVGGDIDRVSNRVQSRGYDTNSWGGMVWASYPINQYLKYGVHYRLRNTDVVIKAEHGEVVDPKLIAQSNSSGVISAIGTSLAYDSTNSILRPSKGFRSKLQEECVGLGGDTHFINLSYLNSYYWGLDCRNTLKFRFDARFLFPIHPTTLDTVPLDERLFLGGESMLRGWRPYAIGPTFSSGEPSGGLSSVLFSIEHNYVLFSRMDLFAFFDSGDVSPDYFNIDKMHYSVGFGVKFALMGPTAPPISVGMGFPINPDSRSEVKKFFLSISGRF